MDVHLWFLREGDAEREDDRRDIALNRCCCSSASPEEGVYISKGASPISVESSAAVSIKMHAMKLAVGIFTHIQLPTQCDTNEIKRSYAIQNNLVAIRPSPRAPRKAETVAD